MVLPKSGSGLGGMRKPEKIYLNNTNQIYAIGSRGKENIGIIRETFFAGMRGGIYQVSVPKRGDFYIDGSYTFEIGGRNIGIQQIKGIPDSYLAIDDIETGMGK